MKTNRLKHHHTDYIVAIPGEKMILTKVHSTFSGYVEDIMSGGRAHGILFSKLEILCKKMIYEKRSNIGAKYLEALKFARVYYNIKTKEFSSVYFPKWFLIKITKEIIRLYELDE